MSELLLPWTRRSNGSRIRFLLGQCRSPRGSLSLFSPVLSRSLSNNVEASISKWPFFYFTYRTLARDAGNHNYPNRNVVSLRQGVKGTQTGVICEGPLPAF
jgi:hypothetical protein